MNEQLSTDATYRLLIQSITDYAIYLLSPDGTVTNWNAGAQRAKGYTAEEVVGTHFSRFYTPEDRACGLPQRALATAVSEGVMRSEGWRVRKDGSRFWAHVTLRPVHGADGELLGFSKVTRDRTEYKQQVDQLQCTKETLDLALSNMSEGLCLFNAAEEVVLANAQYEQALQLKPGVAAQGTTLQTIVREWLRGSGSGHSYEEQVEREVLDCRARLKGARKVVSTERQWAGRTISINERLLPDGGWVATVQDVTDRKLIERQIEHMAHHDALTELPNRVAFRKQLDARLRQGEPCAVLYLDLDRFKAVNDTLGHGAGDEVLQVAASRIKSLLRKGDIGARLGGDEFAVLLSGRDSVEHAEKIASRLTAELDNAIPVGGSMIKVGVSIGVALMPQHAVEAESLLRCADLALYQAKEVGRGCYRVYDDSVQTTVQHRRDLERDLRLALERNEFSLHYQPIVDVQRGVVRSFEALIRWDSPTRGKVSPVEFIPFAEEVGLMPEIGEWSIRTACRQAATWESEECVSVNLSPTQFRDPELPRKVSELLEECGLPAHRLELEITETAMIGDITGARAILTELRSRGIHIALDDFGTGYSSLSFLRNFPFTRIKIDRSFVQDLGKRPESMAIIRAVTGLCQGLGVAATAEGVETEEQMALLQGQGCTEIQGYLIQRPAAAQEATNWLARYKAQTRTIAAEHSLRCIA